MADPALAGGGFVTWHRSGTSGRREPDAGGGPSDGDRVAGVRVGEAQEVVALAVRRAAASRAGRFAVLVDVDGGAHRRSSTCGRRAGRGARRTRPDLGGPRRGRARGASGEHGPQDGDGGEVEAVGAALDGAQHVALGAVHPADGLLVVGVGVDRLDHFPCGAPPGADPGVVVPQLAQRLPTPTTCLPYSQSRWTIAA